MQTPHQGALHSEDAPLMQAALAEAQRGVGLTAPNPAVGSVIAHNQTILARGWHHAAGHPHAEIEALKNLPHPADAKNATLYVSLEPCSTHGRTPPCTEAIIQSGIKRVVVACLDANPAHAGAGIQALRNAGIETAWGILETEALWLNRAFFKRITTGLPWVIWKCAMTLDGKISLQHGQPTRITGDESLLDTHRLRTEVDAILIGATTARIDNPSLTIRHVPIPEGKKQPWRVVLCSGKNGPLPPDLHLLTDSHRNRTLIHTGKSLAESLTELASLGVNSVLLEGGGILSGAFLEQGLVDEACIYIAPVLAGAAPAAIQTSNPLNPLGNNRFRWVHHARTGEDLRIRGVMTRWLPERLDHANGSTLPNADFRV
ncbi:MAG: Diaminohydroxyphosphoribosylaminopyrimidine deaminase / 5-amino-6-(5-phosphoribosylamino)uracil [Verrucomicrobiota bacterium]|jgi:diaminohydroxyphosphoribosylaminopyrimidine deaminase/5-amino-6-(5-phosphoribosylamino)uracil reductase